MIGLIRRRNLETATSLKLTYRFCLLHCSLFAVFFIQMMAQMGGAGGAMPDMDGLEDPEQDSDDDGTSENDNL